MKTCVLLLALGMLLSGCGGPGGPAERAGRSVDNAVYNVGTAVERTGEKIQNAAD